jgi:hypothetical protein
MSNSAITSLERSIDALLARAGTDAERPQDVSMVDYLREKIREIEEKHKKRPAGTNGIPTGQTTDNNILGDGQSKGNHRSKSDCDCGLCTDPMPVCDCELCRQCRDEQAALIGLNGTDDNEVHR